ncbi:MAG TPA: ParB/RepB/Spo0J family partition protein [Stellaceae bacterium]|nr:ParB/RepB/Spo0J family partition protein [Stellaceae bacterium]
MNSGAKRQPLGRGLAALFGEAEARPAGDAGGVREIAIELIRPGVYQPRRYFDETELEALAQSIREKGVLQPLLVRPVDEAEAAFELVAGERRWRAAQRAGLHQVPVLIRVLADAEALEIALIENLQREDLSALEEAEAYRRLMQEFGRTQAALGEAVGKSRSHVANTLRLLGLPETVRRQLEEGALTAGHARALLAAADPAAVAAEIIRRGLNVRMTERLVQGRTARPATSARPAPDADSAALERELTNRLGVRVTIAGKPRGGALTLHYSSLDQLDGLLALLRAG